MPDHEDCSKLSMATLSREQMEKLGSAGGQFPHLSGTSEDSRPKSYPSLYMQASSFSPNGNTVVSGIQRESGLFSSSLSELFSTKLRLSRSDSPAQSANTVASLHEEEEPLESLKEIEAKTIGNLLPDEDDLFSGVIGDVEYNVHAKNGDEIDEFDLFSSVGGMELEANEFSSVGHRNYDTISMVPDVHRGTNGPTFGDRAHGDLPSRTLFVRNINNNVEDGELKALFEKYGDVRALYTACKHRGFVIVSYYDIRAAQKALEVLQTKLLRLRELDIKYSFSKDNLSEDNIDEGTLMVSSIDSSVTNDELRQIFSIFGEIKEVRETADTNHRKVIEFFDIRAAGAALCSLNKIDVAGKPIRVEPGGSVGTRRCLSHQEQVELETNLSRSPFDSLSSANMVCSGSLDGGTRQILRNPVRSPLKSFIEPHRGFSIPIDLPSARMMSVGKGVHETIHSFDEMNFGNDCLGNHHPHSLPEYHDSLIDGSPYKTSRTFVEMVGNGMDVNGGFMNGGLRGAGLKGNQMRVNGGGSSGNESSLHGTQHMWSNANSQMIWPHSPSCANSGHSQRLPPVAAFPRVSPLMINATSPVHHYIGSAPTLNPAFWDRRHTYVAESAESSSFRVGSPGTLGFYGGSRSHPMEIASRNMYGHIGGNRMDVSAANAVLRSPQQMGHLFPGRNQMVSMAGSFDSPGERFRNLSHRRSESSSNSVDKKQYELDIDRILRGEDSRTTLMIKNIPNKYTSKMLLAAIDEHSKGSYDFIYLPIDFKNKCNVGYAFINMIDPQKIIPFHKAFDGKKWEKFNSEKVASLAYARIQGKAALIAHFQNSSLMNEDKRCRPILFHTDGPNAGDQEPFPMGSNIRSRPGKSRTSTTEENNVGGSSSTSTNREEALNRTDPSSNDSN